MNEKELSGFLTSSQTTENIKTGSWKYMEPYYQDLTPPCIDRCLTGQDIVIWIRLLEEGRFEEAVLHMYRANPFPAITGRVCPHPCEQPCNRKALGGGIQIRALERFLGDYALQHKILPLWGKTYNGTKIKTRVAIVGSGPAGLSAGFFLRSFGYEVTIIEKEKVPGGLLQTGIPEFRLPKNIVKQEIEKLEALGINFRLNETLGKTIFLEDLLKQYNVVLLAIGKPASSKLGLENENHPQVLDGVEFLKHISYGEEVEIGEKALVIGGGNTAIDCARTLLRLGKKPRILYRRTRKEMPAIKEEVDEAIREGVAIDFLVAPNKLIFEGERLVALECIRMELGPPDESGRARPIPKKGSEFQIPADAIVKAIGEYMDAPYLKDKLTIENKQIKVNNNYQTNIEKVFACGDCANNSGTVGDAIKRGREAAYAIYYYLEYPDEFKSGKFTYPDIAKARGAAEEIAKFKTFNITYFNKEEPVALPKIPVSEATHTFTEIEKTLTEKEAIKEACRCFKCGTCVFCDNCRIFCPELAISFDGRKYVIKYEYCKGCGICVEECPRNAIHLREVNVEKQESNK